MAAFTNGGSHLERTGHWAAGGSRGEGRPQHSVRPLGRRARPVPEPGIEPRHRRSHTYEKGRMGTQVD